MKVLVNTKMRFVHFLYVPFTGLGLFNGFRGNGWLQDRIAVFKRFVLPSLLNQSANGSFYLWISWRPEEKSNPIVQEFMEFLDKIMDLEVVNTFGGCCFWDDKYDDISAGKKLLDNLKVNLPDLANHVGDLDYVLMTIQPSDDIYRCDAVETIQTKAKELVEKGQPESAIGYTKGYIIDYSTKTISDYDPTTNPPFFTIVFPAKKFLDPYEHYRYTGPYKSHEYIENHLYYKILEDRGFMVGTHGANISTTFNHCYSARILDEVERTRVLVNFGIWDAEPLKLKRRLPVVVRTLLNKLPRSWRYRILKFYYSRPWAKQRYA